MGTAEDQAQAMSEFTSAVAHEILTLPELGEDPDWDTYSMVAEVDDGRVGMTAYRYTETGPAVPTRSPQDASVFSTLRERLRQPDGKTWDAVLVKIHRDTLGIAVDFVYGADADPYRVRPENVARLPELLRPRPEDFEGS